MRLNASGKRSSHFLLRIVTLSVALVLGLGLAPTAQGGRDVSVPAGSDGTPANGPSAPDPCGDVLHKGGEIPAPASDGVSTAGGLRVFIDPKTKEIREPTLEEQRAMVPQQAPLRAAPRTTALPQVSGPGGAVGVKLDQSFMVNEVATKNPDGSLSMECITGDENAAKAVTQGTAASQAVRKEDRHEK
jgi:hypothetical protein